MEVILVMIDGGDYKLVLKVSGASLLSVEGEVANFSNTMLNNECDTIFFSIISD